MVQELLDEEFPDVDISVSLIWVDIMGPDDYEVEVEAGEVVTDPRLRQFHDPKPHRLAGRAFGEGRMAKGKGPAFDMYCIYDAGITWEDELPDPSDWYHQLPGPFADPDHFQASKEPKTLRAFIRERVEVEG